MIRNDFPEQFFVNAEHFIEEGSRNTLLANAESLSQIPNET